MRVIIPLFSLALLAAGAPAASAAPSGTETRCADGTDDDGDGLPDCADSDCDQDPACQPDGQPESSDARCSDWIDNDNDGATDCDDLDCEASHVKACQGSWTLDSAPAGGSAGASVMAAPPSLADLPDAEGERNDQACSDGIDNDNDGLIDCQDAGCRLDPSVQVCRTNRGMRFSVVANVAHSYDIEDEKWDTRFTRLQLRALGTINPIQDSFFLISMRAEQTPRVTFAMFQIPIGGGHFLNINSGGGGLSMVPVLSTAKQLLLDRANFVYQSFQPGNGAALEVFGPLGSSGRIQYRTYAAGGSGRFSGNVGGRFFPDGDENYSWSVGGQLSLSLAGWFNRWDTPFLYDPAQLTWGVSVGAKYDQTAQERFPAVNVSTVFRKSRWIVLAEAYGKRELEFESWQFSYIAQLGFLAWPRHIMLAADFGEFIAGDMDNPPAVFTSDLRSQVDVRQWRAAAHWYFWRNVGLVSLLYTDRAEEPRVGEDDGRKDREIRLEAQYRF